MKVGEIFICVHFISKFVVAESCCVLGDNYNKPYG
jgi:hypothetical protein